MPVEPGLIDANVLVYALDADAPQHSASRALLDAARDGSATLYVSSQILCEFYSIVTNMRGGFRCRRIERDLPDAGFSSCVARSDACVDGWLDLLRCRPVTGGDVFDLQIVATMQANGSIRSTLATSRFFPKFRL